MNSLTGSVLRFFAGLLLYAILAFAGSNPSSITLSSSPNLSFFGEAITLTAEPADSINIICSPACPTGAVIFYDGASVLGTASFRTTGVYGQVTATLITTQLALGTHSLSAYYAGNSNYAASTSASLSQAVTLPLPQTIKFGSLGNGTVGLGSFTLNATASSGLTVTFASNSPSICTVSGVTVTLVATGTCSITASQSGNSVYGAATPVTRSFTVLAAQTITFGALNNVILGTSPFAVSATASSGLPVSFASNSTSVCAVSVNIVTILSIGTCSITAGQSGNSVYGVATPVTRSFAVLAAQTITFGAFNNITFGTSPFAISATASSGLPVSFASNSTSVCTVSVNIVTVLSIGTCSITASQSGNSVYGAATPVTRSFTALASGPTATTSILTFAGNGQEGFSGDNGPATSARLNLPLGVAVDIAGNVYIADSGNNDIRKVSNSVITTVAGNGTSGFDGDGFSPLSAELNSPSGVAVDSAGNLYISDKGNNRIRKVSNGVITTVAGNGTGGFSGDNGPATSAALNGPTAVSVDAVGNLYIADGGNNRVRLVSKGVITTVAGNGTAGFRGDGSSPLTAELNNPRNVTTDAAGNLYIADYLNCRIRKVSNSVIATVVGDGTCGLSGDNGPAIIAHLGAPLAAAVDSASNLYIADNYNVIRKVSNGVITTVAGGFNAPQGVAVDSAGNVYVADAGHNRIDLMSPNTTPVITPNGVVPIYSSVPIIQPGSWISIYGSNLASGTFLWNGDFPTSLGGTSVTVNNKPAYLWSVSPTQINLQAPDDTATGLVPVVVTTASGTASETVTLAQFGPSFLVLDSKHVAGIIIRSNGSGAYGGGTYDIIGPTGSSLGYPTVAAKAGDTVELFAVGFGPTNPSVAAGQAFSGAAAATNTVQLAINSKAVFPFFAGLSGAGLYQVNVTIPVGLGTGDQTLTATVGGVQTQSGVVISLQ